MAVQFLIKIFSSEMYLEKRNDRIINIQYLPKGSFSFCFVKFHEVIIGCFWHEEEENDMECVDGGTDSRRDPDQDEWHDRVTQKRAHHHDREEGGDEKASEFGFCTFADIHRSCVKRHAACQSSNKPEKE